MSLFQAREWWESKVEGEEEFDSGSLCIANIDNERSGASEYFF